MTGFAAGRGQGAGFDWTWDLRSVNGRGLDLRLRMPDWIDGLDAAVRAALKETAARGNITLNLRVSRNADLAAHALNHDALEGTLARIAEIRSRAEEKGLTLSPETALDILSVRGVADASGDENNDTAPLRDALLADLTGLLSEFSKSRQSEGAALAEILTGQIAQIADLVAQARALDPDRRAHAARAMTDAIARITADGLDQDRIAQELALLAVKSDITEELDRLEAHLIAARTLLAQGGAIGRKLDFLTQEFNREANTLCSKAGFAPLTAIGLDLKAVIDQIREQVQNLE